MVSKNKCNVSCALPMLTPLGNTGELICFVVLRTFTRDVVFTIKVVANLGMNPRSLLESPYGKPLSHYGYRHCRLS